MATRISTRTASGIPMLVPTMRPVFSLWNELSWMFASPALDGVPTITTVEAAPEVLDMTEKNVVRVGVEIPEVEEAPLAVVLAETELPPLSVVDESPVAVPL